MKIRVVVTLDVDPAAWGRTYGDDDLDIRQDVKNYVREVLQQSGAAAEEGAIRGVTVWRR